MYYYGAQIYQSETKSIGSAETIAAGAALEEALFVASALSVLLNTAIPTTLVVDSKDLFNSVSSCHVPEDRSIRADVQLIRYFL